MIDVHALEMLAEPRQLAESTVADGPVGQQARESREDAQTVTTHAGIAGEEGGHHHVGRILVDTSVCGIERLALHIGADRILQAIIELLNAVAIAIERCHELFEHFTLIAIVGIADALEGTTQRKGRHRERTILRSGIAHIHILDALARCHRTGGIQVDLEVLHRLESHAQLQILGLIGRGGRGNAITHEQPVVLACLLDVGVADESESEIKSRRHQTTPSRLSEGIADIRQESRQRH